MINKKQVDKESLLKTIGHNIHKLRIEKDISQKQIADHLNITTQACSNIEHGKADITISRIFEYANLYDVSFYKILEVDMQKIFNFTNHNNENVTINNSEIINSNPNINDHIDGLVNTFSTVLKEILANQKQ